MEEKLSADNGIYIAEFSDGFRVIHAQAIDSIGYFPPGSTERRDMLEEYFGPARLIRTREEALIEAKEQAAKVLSNKHWAILEYGIIDLGQLEDFE
jgi:hypothetical protein